MLVRAAVPSVRADAAKAILLAATAELSDRNPGLDANAFGTGLVRDDRAVLTAADPSRHARNSISTPGGTRSIGITVTPATGEPSFPRKRRRSGWAGSSARVGDDIVAPSLRNW